MAGDKVAGIVFGADTSELKGAKVDLDELAKAAKKAGEAADGLDDTLGDLGKGGGGGAGGGPKKVVPEVEKLNVALTDTEKRAAKAGISVGQFNNGMRMMPAQFTDIVTQLQGGQNPFTILIQQGGQIKDSFGGLRGAGVALASYINPATIAFSALAVVIGGVLYATNQLSGSLDNAGKAIIESGGKAYQSVAQMTEAANQIAKGTDTSFTSTLNTMALLTRTGKLTTEQVNIAAAATQRWSNVNADMADKMAGYFDKIAKDPVKALAELNSQFNFLTEAQAKQVIALKKSGDVAGASALAFKLFSESQKEMAANEEANLSPMARAWANIKKWASDTANGIATDFMAAASVVTTAFATIVAAIQATMAKGDQIIQQGLVAVLDKAQSLPGGKALFGDSFKEASADLVTMGKRVDDATAKFNGLVAQGNKSFAQLRAEANKGPLVTIAAPKDTDKATKALEDAQKRLTKEKKVQVDAGDKLLEQQQAEEISLKSQLKFLQSRNALDQAASAQRKKLWDDQAKFQVLEETSRTRALSKTEKQVLAQKDQVLAQDEINAKLGDQIVKQQKLNELSIRANKFTEQTAAKIAEINAKADGKTDREASRASTMSRLSNEYASNPEAQKKVLDDQQKLYSAEDEQRGNWIGGVKKSFAEYAEAGSDAFQLANDAATGAFASMNDTLLSWITTGKASFKDFAKSILSMLAEIALKIAETMAIKMALSSMGYSSGGYTGDGGKFDTAGVVHKGEFVMTKEATSRIGVANLYKMMRGYASGGLVGGSGAAMAGASGGGSVIQVSSQVTVNSPNNAPNKENAAQYQRDVQAVIDESVQKGIDRAMKDGGRLAKYNNRR